VAVLRFNGEQIVETYQTLINPQQPIPLWITQLTGIDDRMVEEAPSFAEVAEPLKNILSRGIFTAHNAGFDYGFVSEEFRRLGVPFERPTCCTLRLARHLCPELPSRSLGVLCESFLIDIWDRHRAFGDAEATVYVLKELIQKAKSEFGVKSWPEFEGLSQLGPLHLPEGILINEIVRLPSKPGTYVFKDEKGNAVYKGQTKDIRRRIKTFFQKRNQSKKSNHFRHVVRSIELVNSDMG